MLTQQTQHTPGPWTQEDDGSCFVTVRDAEGEFVTRLAVSRYHDDQADPECEANNALMVAAPLMLAALQGLLAAHGAVTQGLERELYETWIPKARAAIAKARGGS